jgi:pimeloyl-ACP methyl ester carboxylesterase
VVNVSKSTPADLVRLNLDFLWGGGERLAGLLGRPMRDHVLPRGDDTMPVLTLPGFLAPELSLNRLNRTLADHGFPARSWGLGVNLGPRGMSIFEHVEEVEEELGGEIREMAEEYGHPVALVGQSLGGVYARELAERMPEHVERVITFGSPAIDPERAHDLNKLLRLVGRRVARVRLIDLQPDQAMPHWEANHPPMPLVSIYSPVDRVVPVDLAAIPQEVIDKSNKKAPRENIPIVASHTGMAVNAFVILAILDRLAQPAAKWVEFDPNNYFSGPLRLWPTPFRHPLMHPRGEDSQTD